MNMYEMKITPKKNSSGETYWTASYPQIKEVVGGGKSAEEAVAEANENLKFYLDYLKDEKRPLPSEYVEETSSGNIALRISKTMHGKLKRRAEFEGISVNTLISEAISNYLGLTSIDSKLEEKLNLIHSNTDKNLEIGSYNTQMLANLIVQNEAWKNKITYKD